MDIAITKDGPLVVEINVEPDPIHAASVDIPTLDFAGWRAIAFDANPATMIHPGGKSRYTYRLVPDFIAIQVQL